MESLLNMFSDCDMFSLTVAKMTESIPKVDKIKLLDSHLKDEKNRLSAYYDKIVEAGTNVPDFDTLFAEILAECEAFYEKIRGKDIGELCGKGSSPFICDHVGKDTKYSEPIQYFWRFYHNIQHVLMTNDSLLELNEIDALDVDALLDGEKALRGNFLSYEYTYLTHCTGGPLQLVLMFKLNEETKEWLMQFEDDFALEGSKFEDLAFYQNGELKFSSCTHEGFNSLD